MFFFLTSTQTQSLLLAIMLTHHMLITTSRNYTCVDVLAYLGCSPYPLFEAPRLKCHSPSHFCMVVLSTYLFSEILLGSQLVPHSLVHHCSLMLSLTELTEYVSALMESERS